MEEAIDENDMDEVKYCANVIKESSSTIKTELRDLMNLLNISLNKNKIPREESREGKYYIHDVIESVLHTMATITNKKRIVLHNNVDRSVITENIQEDLMHSIILNLISNSIKALDRTKNPEMGLLRNELIFQKIS